MPDDYIPWRNPLDDEQPRGFQIVTGVANTYRALANPFLQTSDAMRLTSMVCSDPELVRTWLDTFAKLEGELFQNKTIFKAWCRDMYVELNALVNSLDDVSRGARLNYAAEMWMAFEDINPAVLIKPILLGPGKLMHISGVMSSGKTDFGCTLADICLQHDLEVITNIRFRDNEKLPEGLHRCVKMSNLLLRMITAREEKRDVVVVFDETSEFFSRRDAATKGNIQLEKLLRLIRKFRTSMIFVEQVQGGLPTVALEMLTAAYHKLGRKKLHYATRNMERNYNLFLDNVPATELPFDTYHPGGFIIDLDLGELFRDVLIEEHTEEALRRLIEARTGKSVPTIVKKRRTPRRPAVASSPPGSPPGENPTPSPPPPPPV